MTEMMTSYVHLKALQKSGWITEVSRGVWMRSPVSQQDKSHVMKLCKSPPNTRDLKTNPPTIAIITVLMCEKYAMDVMVEKKITYIKCRADDEGEPFIYTVGKLGAHRVVLTKLSTHRNREMSVIGHEMAVTQLLELFPRLEHIILVGVGGAVPNYSDYRNHVRLGDIVVSSPHKPSGPVYMYCDKVFPSTTSSSYAFTHRSWWAQDDTISSLLGHMKTSQERDTYSSARPWERQIDVAIDMLSTEPEPYARPSSKTDRLYAFLEGETQPVLIEHPKPLGTRENRYYRENKPNVRFGPIAGSKYVARNMKLRMDFAEGCQCLAYDALSLPTMMVVERHRKESFVIVRGVCDYQDGCYNLDWQPYAAVAAAAYAKHIITAIPTTGQERGGYHPLELPRRF